RSSPSPAWRSRWRCGRCFRRQVRRLESLDLLTPLRLPPSPFLRPPPSARRPVCYEPRPSPLPEVRVPPLQQHTQSVPETRKIQDVKEPQEPPREVAGDVDPVSEIGDRLVTADRRHVALVAIVEWPTQLAAGRPQNVARRGAAALNRALRYARHHLAVAVHH